MATQTIESLAITNETLTMKVYPPGSDTATDSQSATEKTNQDGVYAAAFTDLAADTYRVQLETAGGVVRSTYYCATTADTATFVAYEVPVGFEVTLSDTATSAQLVDDVWDEVLTGGTHNVVNSSGRRLRALNDFGLYEGGYVWIDTVNGTAGTTDFENGTVNNPVDSIADALTLAASVGLPGFHLLPGSSITLAASVDNYEFTGHNYTVALGGQSVSGSLFRNATITGNDDGTNTTATVYENCSFTDSSLGLHQMRGCSLGGTTTGITMAEAGTFYWDQCYSGVAGTGTPIATFSAGVQNLNLRHWSGGMQIEAMAASDSASVEGFGQVVEGTCTGGTVAIRGNMTVSGITNLTLSDDARIDVAQINAEADTAISDAALATAAALATVDSNLDTIYNSTIVETGTAQAGGSFAITLAAGASATNDFYNGYFVAITGGTGAGQENHISDYNGTTKVATVSSSWVTQPDNTSTYSIVLRGVSVKGYGPYGPQYYTPDFTNYYPLVGADVYEWNNNIVTGDGDWSELQTDVDSALTSIGTISDLGGGADIANNLADMAGATFSTTTDSLEAIRNRGDANWSAAGSSPLLILNSTISSLSSQVSFSLSSGSDDDDAYNGMSIIVTDAATSTQKCLGHISDYTGSTKTITLRADPGVFVMSATDVVDIVAVNSKGIIDANLISSSLSATTVNSGLTGSVITQRRGDTWSFSITGLGDLTGRQKLWFGIKTGTGILDDHALLQIEETDGLLHLNGSDASTSTDASITVTDVGAGDITIYVKPAATKDLDEQDTAVYDVQWMDASNDIYTLSEGKFTIFEDVNRATS